MNGFDMKLESVTAIKKYVLSFEFIVTIGVIFVAIFGWFAIKKIIEKNIFEKDVSKSIKSKVHIAETILKTLFVLFIIIFILQINGVNVNALVTGMGITSIIIGFALQDLLKDWFMGISIFWDEFYNIGDVIKVDDTIGKVIKLSLKCTKISDIYTGNIVSISNRDIHKVEIISDWFDIHVPVAYEVTVEDRKDIISKICNEIKKLDGVVSCEYRGIQEFGESYITEFVRVYTDKIESKPQLRRWALTVVKELYDINGYSVPYNKLDVHMVENTIEKDV